MPDYSFDVVSAADILATDFGGSQEDMSNVFNWFNVQSVTFTNPQSVSVTDDDARFNDDDTSQQVLAEPYDGLPAGTQFEPEQYIDLVDSDGNSYRLVAISTNGDPNTIASYAFVGTPPPYDTPLTIQSRNLTDLPDDDYSSLSQTICFAAGTRIQGPDGYVLVERLSIGDLVLTRDHGAQEIKAVLMRELDFTTAPEHLKPIQFKRSSLSNGRPDRDLCVSPQHRMLVTDKNGQSVLAPAKALTRRKGVRVMHGKRKVTYFHLVFSQHEIVRANGTLTESFFPGPMAFKALPASSRRELYEIFGDTLSDPIAPSESFAAPVLGVQYAKRQALTFS